MQQYAEMKLTETMSFIAEKRRDRLSAARVTWNKLAKDKPLTAAVATQVLMAKSRLRRVPAKRKAERRNLRSGSGDVATIHLFYPRRDENRADELHSSQRLQKVCEDG